MHRRTGQRISYSFAVLHKDKDILYLWKIFMLNVLGFPPDDSNPEYFWNEQMVSRILTTAHKSKRSHVWAPALCIEQYLKMLNGGFEVVVRCTSHLSGQSMAYTRPQQNEHHSSCYNNIAFRVNARVGFSTRSLGGIVIVAVSIFCFKVVLHLYSMCYYY